MYIYNTGNIDKQGRLCLSGSYGNDETLYFYVEINNRNERFIHVQNFKMEKVKCESAKVDGKGRVIIPKWIRDFLGFANVAIINFKSEGGKTTLTVIDADKIEEYAKNYKTEETS